MRTLSLLLGVIGTVAAAGAQPPGAIVIRPGGNGATETVDRYPDKAGFIVVRPGDRTSAATIVGPEPTTSPKLVGDKTSFVPGGSLLPAPVAYQQPEEPQDGKIILETWDAVFLKGQKVGHFHTLVREYEREGKKLLYAIKTQKLTVARFGQVVEQWAEDSTVETADGQILTTRMLQGIGKDQKISLSGKVRGNKLVVQIEGAAGGTQEVPWPADVIGVAREANLLREHKPKVGESFDYLWYEGRLNRVVKFTATVKGTDEHALYLGEKPRKLLRVELVMDPIGDFRLPTVTLWADAATLEPLKMESDMPTFGGRMTVVRTTKETALRPAGKVPDLFDVQSVKLDRAIPNVHDQAAVTYKVRLASDLPADKAFKTDDRQAVTNADAAAKTFELTVKAVRGPGAGPPVPAGKEFLSASFFIDWDNEPTKQHARQAAANLPADATEWQKALAVESYVHRTMRATEFSQAMATCSNVAKSLSGDCTEYAMFATGLCRALGVPSRTALGLVYATDRAGKPFLAYHMWFEVHVQGQWLALDATLGRGSVGPGHLKITDASWHEEKSFAPLLPVLTVLSAQPQVAIVLVSGR